MKQEITEYICQYCGKVCKNKNSLAQHEIRCKENPNKIKIVSNFIEYNNSIKSGERKASNQFIKAKELGLSIPKMSDETKQKISNVWKGRKHTKETKEKISKTMQQVVKDKPDSYNGVNINGKVKKYKYNNVSLDGTWELIFVQYLDKNNIKWKRPNKGIEYVWENTIHIYYPDFFLVDYNVFVEIKGFQTPRDIAKWKMINNLIVIKQNEIKQIQNNEYNIFLYLGS